MSHCVPIENKVFYQKNAFAHYVVSCCIELGFTCCQTTLHYFFFNNYYYFAVVPVTPATLKEF